MSEACIFSMCLKFLAESTAFDFVQAHPVVRYSYSNLNVIATTIPEQIDHIRYLIPMVSIIFSASENSCSGSLLTLILYHIPGIGEETNS